MLRITVQEAPDQITLKLEGSLVGAWVTELEDAWLAAKSGLSDRFLYLDLTAVDRVDLAGKYLLLLLRERGAGVIASGREVTDGLADIVEGWTLRNES
jgi:ABC-type transporter Mla MlaB component